MAKPTATAGRPVAPASHGTVWIDEADHIEAVDVTTGASDGSFTEIVAGDVREGTTLAMRVTMPGAAAATSAPRSPTSNPLMGQTPRRF